MKEKQESMWLGKEKFLGLLEIGWPEKNLEELRKEASSWIKSQESAPVEGSEKHVSEKRGSEVRKTGKLSRGQIM